MYLLPNMRVSGLLYPFSNSTAFNVEARLENGQLYIHYGENRAAQCALDALALSTPIPGVPVQATLPSGERFVPNDPNFVWPGRATSTSIASLERHTMVILSALLLTPLLIYALLFKVVPACAVWLVEYVPESVVDTMGQQSMYVIEESFLSPSELSVGTQQQIHTLWRDALKALDLPGDQYQLSIYDSEHFGANAFALPHGQIVITDDLIEALKDNPSAIRAILLHEIGHVERKHSIRLAAQAFAGTIAMSFIFGDMEGVVELLIGSGNVVMGAQFSQDMEWEADQFALDRLAHLGHSNDDFAQALQRLQSLTHDKEEPTQATPKWLEYLSTHPSLEDRIKHAQSYQKN
ncbi:M48 family metallopeptidase [Pseudoalteromonas obscura]|uniref:M48 family metallopeptidase n=1 Tax=Pseudoalteromonas obscura TaxID=3048491 RepID=A0ABT7ELW3_9GAMM|nr:M48 family metallopeptidase [Pseudoalteromonas sp. P94(2023)]MDK2596016.1 M48 family metallopeptidase [Pseudoalteromonas sp. P94(2023)]